MLYKGKYMIGIYSLLHEGETLLALVDNVHEFAKLVGISYNSASVIISKLFAHKRSHIVYQGRIRTVEFIEDN